MTGSLNLSRQAALHSGYYALIASVLLLTLSSCSGGGGSDSSERTRETAVRIVHASIDTTPIDLTGPEGFVQSARYNQATEYVPVPEGAVTL
ncbi:MAG: hypothetical protein PHC51_12285, partial [bacterium]|nr:hypothetical protein [bacterium]